MPLRSEWKLGREGFTFDTVLRLIQCTVLNPYLTFAILAAFRYTSRGHPLLLAHPKKHVALRALFALGVLDRLRRFLDDGVLNNWTSDKYDWEKEVVVVTGGSDGIGKCVVLLMAERGIKVVVLDVRELTYEAPPTVRYVYCDLGSHESIASATSEAAAAFGAAPTIFINNAGIGGHAGNVLSQPSKPPTAGDKDAASSSSSSSSPPSCVPDAPGDATAFAPSNVRAVFAVNALSHYALHRAFVPAMAAANHGMVVTVASVAAYIAAPGMNPYSASKAAALALHETLHADLAVSTHPRADRVRTVAVLQGYVRTELFRGFDEGDGFLAYALEKETVAEAVVRAVLRGRSAHVVLPVGTGTYSSWVRAMPSWMQYGVRKSAGMAKLMQGYRGRMVEQPSEAGMVGGGEQVEDSKVFVERGDEKEE
ncbi:hypothetical protein BDY21DRAFT_344557 [Lineolata rhizophorae]|uniref:NAD(P)-binding protein n=1 Tax=Lineolata rhizophorae TaxID=578093 RepID=A0A6A6P1A7_9PEZI|nr:hypothetical protein BDY21DRAFT_344557 [Lineolata rhizophorae]